MIINTVFIGPSIWALNDLPAAIVPFSRLIAGAWRDYGGRVLIIMLSVIPPPCDLTSFKKRSGECTGLSA